MRDRSSSRRRLELDHQHGMIIGLCAGLGRYFNVDVTWVRIGAIVGAVFLTKAAIAAYVIGWLVLDERTER
jgi:phage shock protein PspC (stress-responsive transcriptional regulator)